MGAVIRFNQHISQTTFCLSSLIRFFFDHVVAKDTIAEFNAGAAKVLSGWTDYQKVDVPDDKKCANWDRRWASVDAAVKAAKAANDAIIADKGTVSPATTKAWADAKAAIAKI